VAKKFVSEVATWGRMNDTDCSCGDGGTLVTGRGIRRPWLRVVSLVATACLATTALIASSGNSVAAAGVERTKSPLAVQNPSAVEGDYSDPALRLDLSPTHPKPGQRITYVATVGNKGTLAAQAVRLSLVSESPPLDKRGTPYNPWFVSAAPTKGSCLNHRPGFWVSCEVGTLQPGERMNARVVVVGRAPKPCFGRIGNGPLTHRCTLQMSAGVNYQPSPNENPPPGTRQGPYRVEHIVRFFGPKTRPAKIAKIGCGFPGLPNSPRMRACYAVRIRGVETVAWSRTTDLRKVFGCSGAPVITGGASQSIAFVSGVQPAKVFGTFPVLETRSGGKTSSSGFARFGPEYSGLQFLSKLTVVRNAHGELLEEDPDPETACAGGPVPTRRLVTADCGKRVFARYRVVLSYNGPGHFKVFLDDPLQLFRRCDLGGEAGGAELVEWTPIYFAGSKGRPLNRKTFYRTRIGRTVVFRGSYRRQHQFGAETGQVTVSFTRLS
jgi:hypothetical protein